MNCPNCGQVMSSAGCCITSGRPIRHCPLCGTLKLCDDTPALVPMLVRLCRTYHHESRPGGSDGATWRALGIPNALPKGPPE